MENNFSQVLQSNPSPVRGVVMPADTSMQNLAEGINSVAGTVVGAYDVYKTDKAVDTLTEAYGTAEEEYSGEVATLKGAVDKADIAVKQNPRNAIAARAKLDSTYKDLVNKNPRAASKLRDTYETLLGGGSKIQSDYEVQTAARKSMIESYMQSGQPLYKNGAYVTEDDMVNWYQEYQAAVSKAPTPSSQVEKARQMVSYAAPSVSTRLSKIINDVKSGRVTQQDGLATVNQFKMQMRIGYDNSVGYGMFDGKNNSTLDNLWKNYEGTFTMAEEAISGQIDKDVAANALNAAQDSAELELIKIVGPVDYMAFQKLGEVLKAGNQQAEYTTIAKRIAEAYSKEKPSLITDSNSARGTVVLGRPQYAIPFMANATGEELVDVLVDMSNLDQTKWEESKEEWSKLPKNAYDNALRNIQSEVTANVAPSIVKEIESAIKDTRFKAANPFSGTVLRTTNMSSEDVFKRLRLNVVNNIVAFTSDNSGLKPNEQEALEKVRRRLNNSKATKALGGYLKLRASNPDEALEPSQALLLLNTELFGGDVNASEGR